MSDERPKGEKIVQAAMKLDGDREPRQAVKQLFQRHYKRVYTIARRITGRPEDAEDVLQTVFLRLLRKGSGDPDAVPDHPSAYLKRSAINASLDLLRNRKRQRQVPLEDENANGLMSARSVKEKALGAGGLEMERLTDRLRRALCHLSPQEAQVFSLKFFEDHSNQEIATLFGTTGNAVNVALHQARKKLQKLMCSNKEVIS